MGVKVYTGQSHILRNLKIEARNTDIFNNNNQALSIQEIIYVQIIELFDEQFLI